jgi:hypothetical protein
VSGRWSQAHCHQDSRIRIGSQQSWRPWVPQFLIQGKQGSAPSQVLDIQGKQVHHLSCSLVPAGAAQQGAMLEGIPLKLKT